MSNEHEHADSPALLPCPFCGFEPVMRRGGRYGFWALCPHCGAALRMSDTEADAARNWNRRATQAQTSAMQSGNAATRKFDEAAFDAAVAKLNGWDAVSDPVAEIRRMRGDAPGDASAMREALERAIDAIQTMISLYDEEHTAAIRIGATWKRSDTSEVNAIVEQARAALAAPPLSAVGNVAKLREALDEIRVAAMSDYEPDADYLIDTCNAALSAPARNCDRYGDEDDAFAAWHDALNDGDVVSVRNAFRWLFAKATEEGESNGSK